MGRCGLKAAFASRAASDATSRISTRPYAADAVAVPPFAKGGRGDSLLLLPMSHATSLRAGKSKSPLAPFFKGGKR